MQDGTFGDWKGIRGLGQTTAVQASLGAFEACCTLGPCTGKPFKLVHPYCRNPGDNNVFPMQARKTAAAARADSKKAAVVISEKWDKKATKYTVESVPHGYGGSNQAYEAARRHPLGREFNTDSAFRDMTRPAVLKSTGVLIDPVKFNKAASPSTGAKPGKKRDAAGPRGSKDLVKRARLRQ